MTLYCEWAFMEMKGRIILIMFQKENCINENCKNVTLRWKMQIQRGDFPDHNISQSDSKIKSI